MKLLWTWISSITLMCCIGLSAVAYPCDVCSCSDIMGEISADCSSRDLNHVPGGLPENLNDINLFNNIISNLSLGLQKYTKLKRVNVSLNFLPAFNRDDFAELNDLTLLDFTGNHIRSFTNDCYPDGLFRDQKKLMKLIAGHNLHESTQEHIYPQVYGDLTALTYLKVDSGPEPIFGEIFQNLTSLTHLVFDRRCEIKTLGNETFKFLKNLKYLSVKKCLIIYIEPETFMPLQEIIYLDMSYNEYLEFANLGAALYGLQNTSIKVLKLNRIHAKIGLGTLLRRRDIIHLRNTNLEEIHIDGNRIEYAEADALTVLPKTLKIISAKKNKFSYGLYLLTSSTLTGLRWLDASHQFPSTENFIPKRKRRSQLSVSNNVTSKVIGFEGFTLYVPPNAKVANFSNSKLSYEIVPLQFGPNKLKVLDMSHNFFTKWHGPIHGLYHLETLDLSVNYCDQISDELLKYVPSLTFLNVSFNYLGYSLTDNTFRNLTRLTVLDMSQNKIYRLPHQLFQNLHGLQELNLSTNFLTNWDSRVKNLVNLTKLDLANNYFDQFPIDLQEQIDNVRNSKLMIYFSGNPLKCDCDALQSLKWLQKTKVNIVDLTVTSCIFSDKRNQTLQHLDEIVLQLEAECTSYVGVMFGVLSIIIVSITVLISGIVFRYRWKLRYLYYLTLNRHRGYLPGRAEEPEYEFDAFVSYADEDRRFVTRDMRLALEENEEADDRLRLCIHHRDFLVGEAIAANILKAINSSRRTVVVLSRRFLQSYWCRYEVEMAKLEGIQRGRNVLLVLVLEDIPVKDLPDDIVHIFKNDSYIEFTNMQEDQEPFWMNLRRALRT